MVNKPLTVAWISDFPVEWLPNLPAQLQGLPRRHPATWQLVLLSEFEKSPDLRLHIILMRGRIEADFTFERNGVVFHVLKTPPWLRLGSLFWMDTRLIERVCNRIKPDLVHAWGLEKGAALIGMRLNYPCLVTVQGLFSWYKQRVPLPPYYRFIARLEQSTLPRAALVTTESNFAVEFLRNRFPGLRVQQAEHAPNKMFFEVKRKPQMDPIEFISIGELSFRKGTDLLIRALERLISEFPFKCTVVSGPNRRYLNSLRPGISSTLKQRLEFKEHLLPHQVAQALETPTLMLLPTRADVSPNAIKEAVVAGVPVVASEVGGIPDYVEPLRNGILFPPEDLNGFIDAIRTAQKHSLFSRGQVEEASLARSRGYLAPARMAESFLSAYDRLLETVTIPS
jgi:glycosyltransferase involved in cell wall biosynthesis